MRFPSSTLLSNQNETGFVEGRFTMFFLSLIVNVACLLKLQTKQQLTPAHFVNYAFEFAQLKIFSTNKSNNRN